MDGLNGTDASAYTLGDGSPTEAPQPPEHNAPVLNVEDETQYLKWLYELRIVVKRDGVSQADIDNIMQIVSQLKANGVEVLEESSVVDTIASLEHFATRGFTTQRTGLHLVPSLEAIDNGIWATIKVWLAKFIAFLKNLWKEFTNRKDENYFEDKYERYVKAIKKVRTVTAELDYKYGRQSINSVRNLQEIGDKVLLEAPLVASLQQVACFKQGLGIVVQRDAIAAADLGRLINKAIKFFHTLVATESNTGPGMRGTIAGDWITGGSLVASMLREKAKVSPDARFIKDNVDLYEVLSKNTFDDKVIPFEDLRQHLKGMIDGLETVNRAKNGALVEGVMEFTESLSSAIGDFQYMCEFFYQSNVMKVVALDTLYRYANAQFTAVYREASKNAISDKIRAAIQYLRDELAKEMAALNGSK